MVRWRILVALAMCPMFLEPSPANVTKLEITHLAAFCNARTKPFAAGTRSPAAEPEDSLPLIFAVRACQFLGTDLIQDDAMKGVQRRRTEAGSRRYRHDPPPRSHAAPEYRDRSHGGSSDSVGLLLVPGLASLRHLEAPGGKLATRALIECGHACKATASGAATIQSTAVPDVDGLPIRAHGSAGVGWFGRRTMCPLRHQGSCAEGSGLRDAEPSYSTALVPEVGGVAVLR